MDQQIADRLASVVCDELEGAHGWDSFLSRCPNAHIEQTNAWAELKQIYGWTPIWLWIARDERILGGAMILTRRVGRLITVGYIERGPVWDPNEPDALNLVTNALSQFASSMHLTYLVIVPPYHGEQAVAVLESMHFRPKPDALPPTGVGKATLLIDLRKDLDKLLADMSMTKRQNLRRAARKGVRVRIGDGTDAEVMRELMWMTCRRRGFSPAPPQKDFFESLWRVMGPTGGVKFFIAEINGQPVAAATVLVFDGMMQLWRVGWSGTHDDCNPNDLLHWEMIKWAKENGCRLFDFMHIRPDHARAILSGKRVKDSYSGVTEFKMSFGGQIQLLPDLYYRSYHPIVSLGLKLGAARIIESGVCRSALSNALSRS
jgi:lipid II:glycine glycyltransferase (peptidoglycan interpeptide bridge formation enzyme)